nr:hypothetical protein [Clostridia bacterium]
LSAIVLQQEFQDFTEISEFMCAIFLFQSYSLTYMNILKYLWYGRISSCEQLLEKNSDFAELMTFAAQDQEEFLSKSQIGYSAVNILVTFCKLQKIIGSKPIYCYTGEKNKIRQKQPNKLTRLFFDN